MNQTQLKKVFIALVIIFSPSVFAQDFGNFPAGMPTCRDKQGNPLTHFDNQKVMQLKKTTQNLYKEQVFVKAKLVSVEDIKSNAYGKHLRFIITFANAGEKITRDNLIEISHSLNGYSSPTREDLAAGPIYICGEYSTTDVNKLPEITNFEPSVTGAMIHWTHLAGYNVNKIGKHPHGWIFANGKLFGTIQK